MKLTVLGSGSTIPHPARSSSGYWLEATGGSLLLDCSATVPHRMANEGLDWINLDAIWISHFHLDHCGGLAPLFAGTKHTPGLNSRVKPLKLFGVPGITKLLDGFDQVHNYRLLEQPFPVEVNEISTLNEFEILPGLTAVAEKTPHTSESHAIRLRDADGKTIMYSADTGFSRSVSDFARFVDLCILECTFFSNKPVQKHLELAEAMFLIREAQPKRAMLTHFYPEWDNIDFEAEIAKFDPACEVIEAVDGLTVNV